MFKPPTWVHAQMQVILYMLMGKLRNWVPFWYSILILEWQGIMFIIYKKGKICSNITFLNWLTWTAFSAQDFQWAARIRCCTRKGEPAVKCDNEVCESSVLNTKRAGSRAGISVLKRQWSSVIRVRHSTVTSEQICSSQADPRPSQEANPAGPGQTCRGGRLGRVIAATHIWCGLGRGSTKVSTKRCSQEKNMAASTSRSICNSS